MGLRVGAATLIFSTAFVANVCVREAEATPSCSNLGGVPVAACSRNPAPHAISSVLGGAKMESAACASVLVEALASLYSYDDPNCYPRDSMIDSRLKYLGNAVSYLSYFDQGPAKDAHLEGSLYCESSSNVLLFAFRGSEDPRDILNQGWYPDWETNVVAHVGPTPRQYIYAFNAADNVKTGWISGRFDNACGQGRPKLLELTGHSKGGAEAQLAAVGVELKAIVFNSDWLAQSALTDVPVPHSSGQDRNQAIRCFPSINDSLREYYKSGAIQDVRMVNDPLLDILLGFRCSLPHANVEWLVDTSSCSAGDGHSIATVIRELKACAVAAPRQQDTNP